MVELTSCSLEGVTTDWGEHIPPNKVTAHDIYEQYRLGAKSKEEDGIWFEFENAKSEVEFVNVASNVLILLNLSDRNWITSLLNYHEN